MTYPLPAVERLAARLSAVHGGVMLTRAVGTPAIEHGDISMGFPGSVQPFSQKTIGYPIIGIQEHHPFATVNCQCGVTRGIQPLIFLMDKDQSLIGDSAENILSTFEQLHLNKGEVFERGVINVFKGLSWDFKTNSPCKFGKKIIVTGLVKFDR